MFSIAELEGQCRRLELSAQSAVATIHNAGVCSSSPNLIPPTRFNTFGGRSGDHESILFVTLWRGNKHVFRDFTTLGTLRLAWELIDWSYIGFLVLELWEDIIQERGE